MPGESTANYSEQEQGQQEVALNEAINAVKSRNSAAAGTKSDTSYRYNLNRFKRFVDEKRQQNIIPLGEKYLTRRNVDFFFTEFVPKLKVEPNTASRILPSFHVYADRTEHIDKRFEVDSVDVRTGLQSQEVVYISLDIGRRMDPHSNLPCHTLTPAEHTKALDTVLRNNYSHWQSLASIWTIGNNSFIRCDTFIKLRLPSLLLNYTHGPNLADKSNAPMLVFILNKTDIKGGGGAKGGLSKKAIEEIKKRAEKKTTNKSSDDNDDDYGQIKGNKRMTGLWRHKDWRRCGIGMNAMSLF